MAEVIWSAFKEIADLAASAGVSDCPKMIDPIVDSALEGVADILPTATALVLREGSSAAVQAFEALARIEGVDEDSTSFLAGKIAAAADLLGYAASQTGDASILQLAQSQPYGQLLDLLAHEPLRNVDVAQKLGKDEAQVSKWLATLREHGGVTSHKRGRNVFNALTPVGRLVVEQGWQDARRAPLSASNLHDLGAHRYDLSRRAAPSGARSSSVPRLSASGQ